MDRRTWLQRAAAGVATPALGAALAPATAHAALATEAEAAAPAPRGRFPANFRWGAATAAYQLEGAAREDGRLPSIWDTFSHTPGKVVNGDTGDVACDHYHRVDEDVALMASLGVKHYRFSIAWPRIIPTGRGAVNEKGVDFYKRLLDALGKHGIMPHATLYHWDLPQALQDRYRGWESREVADDFAAYADVMARRLGDRVTSWMTINEISTMAFVGYGVGSPGAHAPGLALARPRDRFQVIHHALLAHGRAVQALRASAKKKPSVAAAENVNPFVPIIETPEHLKAAQLAFARSDANATITMPMLTGRYDAWWWERQGAEVPEVKDGDLKTIHQPLEWFGFNCYTGAYVRAADNAAGFEVLATPPGYPQMSLPWLQFVPESIYWGIRHIGEVGGQPKLPVVVTENGCADLGPIVKGDDVQDVDRVMYLRSYLRQVLRAVDEGLPVVGYFPWSLMDNFEWAEGYAKRFGLVHVDYQTQKRSLKLSAKWFQHVIRTGRVA
jgi:beta-glucosidase